METGTIIFLSVTGLIIVGATIRSYLSASVADAAAARGPEQRTESSRIRPDLDKRVNGSPRRSRSTEYSHHRDDDDLDVGDVIVAAALLSPPEPVHYSSGGAGAADYSDNNGYGSTGSHTGSGGSYDSGSSYDSGGGDD